HLVLQFSPDYNVQREYCSDPAKLQRLQIALKRLTGQDWAVRLENARGNNVQGSPKTPAAPPPQPSPSLGDPLIQRAVEVLDAKLLQVDERFGHREPVHSDDVDAALPDPEES